MDEQIINRVITDAVEAATEIVSQDTTEQKVSLVADKVQDALIELGVTVTDEKKQQAVKEAQTAAVEAQQKKYQSPVLWISLIMLALLGIEVALGIDLSKWYGIVQLGVPLTIGAVGVFNNPNNKIRF